MRQTTATPDRAAKPAAAGRRKKIRYAVVGQGYIAQVAVLPAFAHAQKNSELAALVSDDPVKLKNLARTYGVSRVAAYWWSTENRGNACFRSATSSRRS